MDVLDVLCVPGSEESARLPSTLSCLILVLSFLTPVLCVFILAGRGNGLVLEQEVSGRYAAASLLCIEGKL